MPNTKPSKAVIRCGTEIVEAKTRVLKAGRITAVFDAGTIRHVRYGQHEVLRGIAFLVRDRNWATYTAKISNLKIRQQASGFKITYDASCSDTEQSISYTCSIEGSANAVAFKATASPGTDFLTNRTGFVVLHPLKNVAGEPVEVIHTGGKKRQAKFPGIISPSQPIFEIRSLKHIVRPGLSATVLMEGNKFEMEDHRNWMDASYKTYVCSLLDPWPYTLKKGVSFDQSITVSLSGKPKQGDRSKSSGTITVSLGKPAGKLPAIGVAIPMAEAENTLAHVELVAASKPAHIICQIDGRQTGQAEAAKHFQAIKEKTVAHLTLEIILPAKASAHDEMQTMASHVQKGGLKPDAVVVTQAHDLKSFQPNTPRPWGPTYEDMATAARAAFPGIKIGGGMLSYFTELNRKPTPRGVFDFISHSVCPIVHAADDVSVMETLESLPSIFASARKIIGKAPYHLGPSSIPCRDNPYGAAVTPNPDNSRHCLAKIDPRQRGLFAAAWNIGLLAAAAEAGLDSVTLGAATGPQGVIYTKGNHAQAWYDSCNAMLFPVYHILRGLAPASGARRIDTQSSHPAHIAALAFQSSNTNVLWLANLTAKATTVKLVGWNGTGSIHRLSERNFVSAASNPRHFESKASGTRPNPSITLGAYEIAGLTRTHEQ